MADDQKTNDSRNRSKPDAPDGAVPENDQRRFRNQRRYGGNGGGDDAGEARDTVDDGETSGDAPMDPPDEEFIKSK